LVCRGEIILGDLVEQDLKGKHEVKSFVQNSICGYNQVQRIFDVFGKDIVMSMIWIFMVTMFVIKNAEPARIRRLSIKDDPGRLYLNLKKTLKILYSLI